MGVFTTRLQRQPRHLQMSGGGTVHLRVDHALVEQVIAEKARLRYRAERRQFRESIAA